MTRPSIVIAMLLAVLTPSTAARAADATNVADVRCVVVALSLARSPDPRMRALATASGLYFIGRLEGRAPDLDLEKAIVDQVHGMSAEDLQSEGRRCGAVLLTQGERLAVIGADLQKAAADAATQAPATPK